MEVWVIVFFLHRAAAQAYQSVRSRPWLMEMTLLRRERVGRACFFFKRQQEGAKQAWHPKDYRL